MKFVYSYKKLLPFFLIILISFAYSSALFSQDIEQKVDEYLNALIEQDKFSGSILVAKDGEVLLKKGYNFANFELDVPNTPQTVFRLGSITKQFTSMLIMQLVEENKIELDNSIADYLPYYRKDTGSRITVHHLLTHTPGIPSYTTPEFFEKESRDPYNPKDFIVKYCSEDIIDEPGTKYAYNNSGYFILGGIIEEVTGKSYEENLQERIFTPLGMNATGFDSFNRIIKNRATGYRLENGVIENDNYLDMTIPFSAGSLYSTVEDLYTWDRSLYTEDMISNTTKETWFTPFKNNYAYGWSVNERNGRKMIGHGGGINGFGTSIQRYVDDDATIIVLCNLTSSSAGAVANTLADILFGDEYDLPEENIEVSVDEEILKEYVGEYEIVQNFVLTITLEEGGLMVQATGQGKAAIFPSSETKFFYKMVEAEITFERNENNEVSGLILKQSGREIPGTKIK